MCGSWFSSEVTKSLKVSSTLMLQLLKIHIIPQNAIVSHAFIWAHKIFYLPL